MDLPLTSPPGPQARGDAGPPPGEVDVARALEKVLEHTGADLSDWLPSVLAERLAAACGVAGVSSVSELLARGPDPSLWTTVGVQLTWRPTSWFADPAFYRLLRLRVIPWLRTYPSVRLWVPGEAGGEEAAALAIVLEEEKLLERCRIYATAPVDEALAALKSGRFAASGVQLGMAEYALAGGHYGLDRYFSWEGAAAVLHERLRKHLVVGQHSLATDGSLNEFHVIACRRAILDFNARLRAKAQRLFWESLPPLGTIALPPSDPPPSNLAYEAIDAQTGLYRRKT